MPNLTALLQHSVFAKDLFLIRHAKRKAKNTLSMTPIEAALFWRAGREVFWTDLSCVNADRPSEGVPKIHDVGHDDGFSFLRLKFV